MARPMKKRKILEAIQAQEGWTSAAQIGQIVGESSHVVSQVFRGFRGKGLVESQAINMKGPNGETLGLSWRSVPPEGGNQTAVESRPCDRPLSTKIEGG